VTGTSERWLELSLEPPPLALPREGMPADGDSGAPVLLNMQGEVGIGRAGLAQIRQRRPIEIPLLCLRSDHLPSPRLPLCRLDKE
jgi:hypothetical protein